MFNNQYLLESLTSNEGSRSTHGKPRRRLASKYVLLERLPSTNVLKRDADITLEQARLRQLRFEPDDPIIESPSASSPDVGEERTNSDEDRDPIHIKDDSRDSRPESNLFGTLVETFNNRRNSAPPRKPVAIKNWKDPQPYEVLRAVERKDIMYLMEIRDRAFHLLLRKTGEVTPLLHAMRIGSSHRDVAIILVGALSRWVNHLDDEELSKPHTKVLLKALRTNLKLAIDYGLQNSQSDLLASFLQTLVMSEGDKWVVSQSANVALALRSDPGEGRPVETAEMAVRAFATKELGKNTAIAALEDYIANATADLLMMGAWNIASEAVGGEPIPTYCFARDERVHAQFVNRIHEHKTKIAKLCTRRLKWQIRLLETGLKGRNITFRRKIEMIRTEMDTGTGP
ncbi:hypothetical protein CPB86DRAFT_846737 [Serendipita vermifera]|nr:hypothetical protein CPB86DRAFT_846737 [Serendipita vermifera]